MHVANGRKRRLHSAESDLRAGEGGRQGNPAGLWFVQVPIMKNAVQTSKIFLPDAMALALLGGCAGTGPNTQRGAVGGAALGALAGAIIGNNSGSHNGAAGAAIGAVAGGLAGGTIGNSIDNERGTTYTSSSQATTE